MKARLLQIGNARGICLPKPLTEAAGLSSEVELRVGHGGIVILPARFPRSGWVEAARALCERGKPVTFALDEELRQQILRGQRTRRLRNLSIELNPVQIPALRKIATMKSIPYQTLIRQWLAEGIRKELQLSAP